MAENKGRGAATIKRGAKCLAVQYNNFKVFSQYGLECRTWLEKIQREQAKDRTDRYVIHVLSFMQYFNKYTFPVF